MLARGLITGPVAHPLKCPRRRPVLAARRPGGVRVASYKGSSNGSVDETDYISFVLNTQPVVCTQPEDSAKGGEPEARGDPMVTQVADEVQQHLQKVNKMNETLKGQLHNVTSGLETVIQSARAHQKNHPLPNGNDNGEHPNGTHPTAATAQGTATIPASSAWPRQLQQQQQHAEQQQQQLNGAHTNGVQMPASEGSSAASDGPGAQHSTSVACVVQHPGALCCTKTTATANPTSLTCTVSLETTARYSMDDTITGQLSMDDLSALAAQALVSAASDYCRSKTQAAHARAHPPERLQQHAELVNVLSHGHLVAAKRNRPSQFGHESYILQLADKHSGRRVGAVFKPRVPGDADGWHRAPIEWVAYELNLMLGMDYVPPVAYRKGGVEIDLGGEEGVVSHEEGAMMYWIENASQLKHYSFELWGMNSDVLLSDTRILDVLLHNSDRHHGHFLLGQHWCQGAWDGSGNWAGDLRPALIDHAAGFRRDAHVTMQHENAFQTGPVRCVSARTYLRLRFLDAATISQKFAEVLSEHEMRELLHRRNYVLRYLDRLVEDQGYAATVVENY